MSTLSDLRSRTAIVLMACCAGAALAAGPSGRLNDTGQTQCDDGVYTPFTMKACSPANTGDAAAMPRQDGRFGRDVANPAKVGGGAAGFDFTKICWNGDAQGSGTCTGALVANTGGAASGTASTDWACTRDNVTNLIWSLQSQSATWSAASAGTYPDAGHNTPSRCGLATGWRLPTRRELLSIVHYGTSSPSIDVSYFPSTANTAYWTSDTYAPGPSSAWQIDFVNGAAGIASKTFSPFRVRLVRSGP